MKIAVVGSGGREHAILWRLSRDPGQPKLYALPGNGGTQRLAESVTVDTGNTTALHHAIRSLAPDLAIIGPEAPLAEGIADLLAKDGILCFGPGAKAAQIEASKVFAKNLMRDHGIPTAEFEVFEDYANLERYVRSLPLASGWVVKADGLAAGKGAYVCSTEDETLEAARMMLVEDKLGRAGSKVVLERKLEGREVSALYLCDGERYAALAPAQDYKRALEADKGPNTGGMGSYCPAAHLTPGIQDHVEKTIVIPTLHALTENGAPYRGVLYAGLILTNHGPQVIEFNCRFGDPETQVILPIWQGDFTAALVACAEGKLADYGVTRIDASGAAVCVVLAAEGYPDSYRKSIPLREVPDSPHAVTFHAGTLHKDGTLMSSGGRVLNAVGLGETVAAARGHAYDLALRLKVDGLRQRRDIAEGV